MVGENFEFYTSQMAIKAFKLSTMVEEKFEIYFSQMGRHNKIPKELRFCPFCPNQIESEIHFLIECNSYKEPRQDFMQIMTDNRPSLTYYTTTEKFLHILSEEFAPFTAKFVHNCFSIREFLIANHRNEI